MSEHPEEQVDDADVEVVDGLPVVAEVRELAGAEHGAVSVTQAAALTAGGFFAGALAMALLKGLAARRTAEPVLRDPAAAWPPGTSRTYLVSVRVIPRPSG